MPKRVPGRAPGSHSGVVLAPCRSALSRVLNSKPRLFLFAYFVVAVVLPIRPRPVLCPFRLATGRNCPLCGLTRSTHELVRGRVRAAWDHNALTPVVWVAGYVWTGSRRPCEPPCSPLMRPPDLEQPACTVDRNANVWSGAGWCVRTLALRVRNTASSVRCSLTVVPSPAGG